MNISKNILSLGLIAVISGVSTAQTYTATAGTNGTTDIQSDYSMSTGDGASVSVDVPLEFELPKKVAIAIASSGTTTLPAMFTGVDLPSWAPSNSTSATVSLTPFSYAPLNNTSSNGVNFLGAIYANTAFSVTVDHTDFVHETDSNSFFKGNFHTVVYDKSSENIRYIDQRDDNDSSTSLYPLTENIDETELAASENLLGVVNYVRVYLDTIDPTDRAGKYTALSTITVTTL